ncbi:AraC family transcriptional regulator [Hahella ganghwensis]|uniref:AraC family transcriptional regulator n=1 Tax=Hahella ganghwensis TaxID=286420 RepID=UPI00037FAF26|nr:helix-turn-helix domain-containing protein [Hahella ganghwensis]
MSTPSSWPLPPGSIRFVVPRPVVQQMAHHPLSMGLYPQGIGYYRKAAGHHMERPVHDDHLLIYCLEGSAVVGTGNKESLVHGESKGNSAGKVIRAGDFLILPRGTPHWYQANPQTPWTIYWAHFDGAEADEFVRHLAPEQGAAPMIHFSLGSSARVVGDFETLLEIRQATYHLNAFINAANQLRGILTHIALLKPLARHQDTGGRFDLERVHSLMLESVHGQLDLLSLANAVNLSKFHFIKKYKEVTGTTPIDHFIRLKIERACHLLDVTHQSVGQVAMDCGYQDAYYFSRAFKKVMGVSPREYRKLRTGAYA